MTEMGLATRFSCRFAAAMLLLSALLPVRVDGADNALARLKYGTRIVCAGEYRGHLQGIASDGRAIYWVFTQTIVKTGFDGKVLAKTTVPRHGGDPCCHDGKLYVPVCTSGFNSKLKRGAVSKNFIYVFDAGLKLLAKHHIPELEYGAGGIAVRDGHFFVIGGRPKDLAGNTVYEYDGNFKFVRRHEVAFDSLKGIQTINHAAGKWYFGCYGTNGLTIEADENFRVLRKVRPNTSVGMIPLANGLVLVGRTTAGKIHNRRGADARVMRISTPKSKKNTAKRPPKKE